MKVLLCVLSLSFLAPLAALHAKGLDAMTNLDEAIALATQEQKALFIICGRATCPNCKNLFTMVEKKDIRLPKAAFIIVNLQEDVPADWKAFHHRYKVEGHTLPFVVIAKPDGTMIAGRGGSASAAIYNDFVRDARRDLKKTD